jgi:hypothetical protein
MFNILSINFLFVFVCFSSLNYCRKCRFTFIRHDAIAILHLILYYIFSCVLIFEVQELMGIFHAGLYYFSILFLMHVYYKMDFISIVILQGKRPIKI